MSSRATATAAKMARRLDLMRFPRSRSAPPRISSVTRFVTLPRRLVLRTGAHCDSRTAHAASAPAQARRARVFSPRSTRPRNRRAGRGRCARRELLSDFGIVVRGIGSIRPGPSPVRRHAAPGHPPGRARRAREEPLESRRVPPRVRRASRGCRPRAGRASPERDPGRDGVARAGELRPLRGPAGRLAAAPGVHPGGRPRRARGRGRPRPRRRFRASE
jgi:hypothetical protein